MTYGAEKTEEGLKNANLTCPSGQCFLCGLGVHVQVYRITSGGKILLCRRCRHSVKQLAHYSLADFEALRKSK